MKSFKKGTTSHQYMKKINSNHSEDNFTKPTDELRKIMSNKKGILHQMRKHDVFLRRQFLEKRAEYYAEIHDLKKESAIKALIHQELTKIKLNL